VRRNLALVASAAFVAIAVVAVALAFASAGSGSSDGERGAATKPVHDRGMGRGFRGGRGGPPGFFPLRAALDGLAERLDVTPERLREALEGVKRRGLDRAVARGVITEAERDALLACMSEDRGGCDREAARSAARKLHRAHHRRGRRGLARMKANVLGDLAAELDKPVGEVTEAVRAELVEWLDRGVAMGLVSGRGRELALACFDRPRSCDLRALKREIFGRFGGRGHGPGGRHGPGGPFDRGP
jgi:hypothetical protein